MASSKPQPGADWADLQTPARYSSRDIALAHRHDHWRATTGAWVASTYDIQALEPFSCDSEVHHLGGVRLAFSRISGQRFVRSAERARRHGHDEIAFALNFTGEARGDADGREFHQPAGALLVTHAARPTAHRSTSGEVASIVLDRTTAIAAIGPEIDTMHGAVVPSSDTVLLTRHLLTLRSHLLSGYRAATAERHGRILTDMLAVIVGAVAGLTLGAGAGAGARQMVLAQRARHEIEAALGSPRLSVATLGARLGVSRPTLHRLFAADGGVEAYIREQRLQRSRMLLANPSETAPIAAIAESLGFADGSHFSRSFRARFGLSPRDYRAGAAAGEA
jgi:AraC-like DNA-binding protein